MEVYRAVCGIYCMWERMLSKTIVALLLFIKLALNFNRSLKKKLKLKEKKKSDLIYLNSQMSSRNHSFNFYAQLC